jgi:hypothetical protein
VASRLALSVAVPLIPGMSSSFNLIVTDGACAEAAPLSRAEAAKIVVVRIDRAKMRPNARTFTFNDLPSE